MKNIFFIIGFGCVLTANAIAGPVPKDIKSRYESVKKAISALDFKAFSNFFAPEFVTIDPKGKSSTKAEFLAEVKPFFTTSKSANAKEKLISSTTKNGIVNVKFDMVLSLKGKDGTTVIHEVGTDSWKMVSGKWLMVKTVDTKFDIQMPNSKIKH